MSARTVLPPPVEFIRLRRVNPDFAIANVRIPGVHLQSIRVALQRNGSLLITAPTVADRNGRPWPCFSMQPGTQEPVEAAIVQLWEASL